MRRKIVGLVLLGLLAVGAIASPGFRGNLLSAAILVAGVGVYFLPTLIVGRRKRPQSGGVFILNLLLGWTVLGWVVSLVWALG